MVRSADDLSALSRRGALSAAEERRLAVYLGASDDARLFHEVGRDYDRMQTRRPDDAALLERVQARVLARHARTAQNERRRGRVPIVIALGLLLAGAAGAAAGILRGDPSAPRSASQPSVPAHPTPRATLHHAAEEPVSPRTLEPAPSSGAATRSAPSAHAVRREAPARAAPLVESNAATPHARALFSRANAQRKAGEVGEALRSYAELRRVYPASSEAALSRVLSGRLLFAGGDAEGAAREFEAYLVTNPGGALAEEALHGKAVALRALGRTTEELRTWQLLLERFPSSIHAPTARERLSRDR